MVQLSQQEPNVTNVGILRCPAALWFRALGFRSRYVVHIQVYVSQMEHTEFGLAVLKLWIDKKLLIDIKLLIDLQLLIDIEDCTGSAGLQAHQNHLQTHICGWCGRLEWWLCTRQRHRPRSIEWVKDVATVLQKKPADFFGVNDDLTEHPQELVLKYEPVIRLSDYL